MPVRSALLQLSRQRLGLRRVQPQIDDALAHMRNAGAGWYYDPDDEAIYRYWDGSSWTDRRADILPAKKTL